MDPETAVEILRHVPHFHACAVGPSPSGPEFVARVSIDLFVQSLEEAWRMLPGRVERMCGAGGVPYDEDEWVVLHMIPVNLN